MTGRWDIRLRQGDVQFFTVRQLGDQRLPQQGRLPAGLAEGAVQPARRRIATNSGSSSKRLSTSTRVMPALCRSGQQGSKLLAELTSRPSKGSSRDQQLRIGHQGLTRQGLTRFPVDRYLNRRSSRALMPNCSAAGARSGQGSFTSSWIISAVVRPVSSSPGLSRSVLLRCHSLLTSFCNCSKERRVTREKVAFALAAEQGQVACQGPREGGLPLPLLPTNAQLSPAATPVWSIFKVFVSLRRNVPCEICNDDMMYPIFCSDVHQGIRLQARNVNGVSITSRE